MCSPWKPAESRGNVTPSSSPVRFASTSLRRWLSSSFAGAGRVRRGPGCAGAHGAAVPAHAMPVPCGQHPAAAVHCRLPPGLARASSVSFRCCPQGHAGTGVGVVPWRSWQQRGSVAAAQGRRWDDAPWSVRGSHVCAMSIPMGLGTALGALGRDRGSTAAGGCGLGQSTHASPSVLQGGSRAGRRGAERGSLVRWLRCHHRGLPASSHHNRAGCSGGLWAE